MAKLGMTQVLVTHDVSLARRADVVFVLGTLPGPQIALAGQAG